MGRGFKNLK